MQLVLSALDYARKKHHGQVRRSTNAPYITHPVAVSYIVASFKKSKHHEELLVSAILHDVLEDTDATEAELIKRFGPLVASIVIELTNCENEIKAIGKLEYQKKKLTGMSSYALVIKLADRLDNIRDNPTNKMLNDTEVLIWHIMDSRKLTKTQMALSNEILRTVQMKRAERAERTEKS